MTAPEYIQLRAFARYDGLKLFVLWLISFVCYVLGPRMPFLGIAAAPLAAITPLVAYQLLRHYRDVGLGGVISVGRGWAYVVFLFLYASLLFALAQFVYFAFLDKGYFVSTMSQMMSDPATSESLRQMGMLAQVNDALRQFEQMRPIDLVLNILTTNLFIGCVVGLPVAAIAARSRVKKIRKS